MDKSGAEVAKELLKIFFNFGFLCIIQSNNRKEFVNSLIKEIVTAAKVDHRLITPYHPQANGSAERAVQTAKRLIYKLIKGIKQEWSLFVPFAQFCINSKISARTKSTPFSVMFGRPSNLLEDHNNTQKTEPNETNMIKRIEFMQDVLFPAITEATKNVMTVIKKRFDRKYKIIDIPAGTYVMIADKTRNTKSDPANEGLFKIIRKTQGGSYELQDLDGEILKRCYPPNDLIPISNHDLFEEESYEVNKILDHRYNSAKEIEYKVRWKGYNTEYDTWEPFANFDSVVPIDKY